MCRFGILLILSVLLQLSQCGFNGVEISHLMPEFPEYHKRPNDGLISNLMPEFPPYHKRPNGVEISHLMPEFPEYHKRPNGVEISHLMPEFPEYHKRPNSVEISHLMPEFPEYHKRPNGVEISHLMPELPPYQQRPNGVEISHLMPEFPPYHKKPDNVVISNLMPELPPYHQRPSLSLPRFPKPIFAYPQDPSCVAPPQNPYEFNPGLFPQIREYGSPSPGNNFPSTASNVHRKVYNVESLNPIDFSSLYNRDLSHSYLNGNEYQPSTFSGPRSSGAGKVGVNDFNEEVAFSSYAPPTFTAFPGFSFENLPSVRKAVESPSPSDGTITDTYVAYPQVATLDYKLPKYTPSGLPGYDQNIGSGSLPNFNEYPSMISQPEIETYQYAPVSSLNPSMDTLYSKNSDFNPRRVPEYSLVSSVPYDTQLSQHSSVETDPMLKRLLDIYQGTTDTTGSTSFTGGANGLNDARSLGGTSSPGGSSGLSGASSTASKHIGGTTNTQTDRNLSSESLWNRNTMKDKKDNKGKETKDNQSSMQIHDLMNGRKNQFNEQTDKSDGRRSLEDTKTDDNNTSIESHDSVQSLENISATDRSLSDEISQQSTPSGL